MTGFDKGIWRFPENIEKLKQLWAQGLSCSLIAERIGGLTRNAIIGKVHRLGLPKRITRINQHSDRPRKPREPRANHHWRNQKFGRGPQATPKGPGECSSPSASPVPTLEEIEAVELVIDVSDPPESDLVSFADLERHHCRFPISGKFCGRQTVERVFGTYCAAHAERCYQGAPKKIYVSKFHTEGPKQKEQAA